MNFHLRVWRQKNTNAAGRLADYEAKDIPEEASFLEMLDIVNDRLTENNEAPIAFDSDCREGICGACCLVINGLPHGPGQGTTCQLRMRDFTDGDTLTIEPFRARPMPVLRDLVVDRTRMDRIIEAGGYITARAGSAPEANNLLISKEIADHAMDSAACIGCGACVAACKNASAMLFMGAKVSQLALLPQGQPERDQRVLSMVRAADDAGFGNCTNYYECEAVCPAEIKRSNISRLNREYARASAKQLLGWT